MKGISLTVIAGLLFGAVTTKAGEDYSTYDKSEDFQRMIAEAPSTIKDFEKIHKGALDEITRKVSEEEGNLSSDGRTLYFKDIRVEVYSKNNKKTYSLFFYSQDGPVTRLGMVYDDTKNKKRISWIVGKSIEKDGSQEEYRIAFRDGQYILKQKYSVDMGPDLGFKEGSEKPITLPQSYIEIFDELRKKIEGKLVHAKRTKPQKRQNIPRKRTKKARIVLAYATGHRTDMQERYLNQRI